MPELTERALMWLRRDLGIKDNQALFRALTSAREVYCVFVFDTDILNALEDKADRRVEFIWESLAQIHQTLIRHGSVLTVLHGRARDEIPALAARLKATAVFANRDYEPDAVGRDAAVEASLRQHGIEFSSFKNQVIFEKDEVLTQEQRPFSVFTAYKNAWHKRLTPDDLKAYPSEKHLGNLARMEPRAMPSLESIGFTRTNLKSLGIPAGASGAATLFDDFLERIENYQETRNYPSVKGPLLPVGASALRHPLHPYAGARRVGARRLGCPNVA